MQQNERVGNLGTHGTEEKFVQYMYIGEKSLNQRDLLQYLGEDGGKKKSLEISKS
jgi:hypothetical protein